MPKESTPSILSGVIDPSKALTELPTFNGQIAGVRDSGGEGEFPPDLLKRFFRLTPADSVKSLAHSETTVTTDPMKIYSQEITQHPLLTKEEEIRLAQKKDEGVAAALRLAAGNLSAPEEQQCNDDIKKGNEAKTLLKVSNLRLVVSVAIKHQGHGVPLVDLIQEGNIGLRRGVEKYDWRKDFRFSTYAYWWIRQGITRSIADQARTIRIPVHMIEAISRLANTTQRLTNELGRKPSKEELAREMDTSPENIRRIIAAATIQPRSLEDPVRRDEEDIVADFIEDPNLTPVPEQVQRNLLVDEIEKALVDYLEPREGQVLRLRFGLDGVGERTLNEVGQELGISRERVRQIEAEALAKFRKLAIKDKFREYLE